MTVACEVINCVPGHLNALAAEMRLGDVAEVMAMGLSPKKAVWSAYRASYMRRTYLIHGKVAAVGGCSGSLLSPVGTPWLLTSQAVESLPIPFAIEARKQARELLEIHSVLRNYVDARYHKAIRFLELIGFEVGAEEKRVNDATFVSFEMRRAA